MLASFSQAFPPGQLLTRPVELLTYEVDAANDRGTPHAVLLIRSVEDVQKAIRLAAEHGLPIVARGAGTGLSGGAVAHQGGIILEFSQFNRLLEFDPAGRSVIVQPGMVNLKLDEFVKKSGLYFPPDPASGRSATIGGNLAENAGGPHCFKYGVTTNYVTGLQVVLADGRLIQLGGRALDYPEYDFCGLLTGSEGTLGIITQASFRLLRNPPAVKTMMAAFDTIADAGNAVSAIIARGLTPATMEFMDQSMMGIIESYAHAGLPTEAGAALIIEVDGYPASLDPQMEEIVGIVQGFTRREIRVAQSAEERDRIWYGRKSAAGAMARLSPAYYLLDGTVPRSQLADALQAINAVCHSLGLRVAYVFHAGDGNLHPFILIENPSDPTLMERVHQAGRQVMEICVGRGGSITGEHGVGIEKRAFMPLMYSPLELQVMQDIKNVFDPQNILNPGKILPAEGMRPALEPASPAPNLSLPSDLAPATTEEAAELLRALTSQPATLRIRGAGTKSTSLPPAVRTLATHHLRGIYKYALEDLYITVGAGQPLQELQAELARDNMWLPLISPWPQSTLGGITATNYNAPLRMRYGGLRDLLLAATVILPDGRLIRAGRPVVKNVAGYDLPKLFVGSFGTLGLLTDLTFKLAPLPRARRTLAIPFESLPLAIEMGRALLQIALNASALLLCHNITGLSTAPWHLVYSVEGLPQDVTAEIEQVHTILREHNAPAPLPESATPLGNDLWAAWMRTQTQIAQNNPAERLLRLGLAPKDLPAFLQNGSTGTQPYMADLASGLLYLSWQTALTPLVARARELGGYLLPLAGEFPSEPLYQPESLHLMRRLKAAWDASLRFNPVPFLL
ncbi:MAG: FAD-binding oxidoreductase [Anaerolineae bacterium]|nr:MAG: FAD-binding oxidoreductase [Anaerolineae bacterium]